MVSVFLESLFLQCIWKRSSHQKHVPSSVKWKLKSVERCYGGLWMGAEHKVSPVLASTCNATHLVQKVHKRTHLWREKEKTAGLRVERGRTPLLCEEWLSQAGTAQWQRNQQPSGCSILTHPGESPFSALQSQQEWELVPFSGVMSSESRDKKLGIWNVNQHTPQRVILTMYPKMLGAQD